MEKKKIPVTACPCLVLRSSLCIPLKKRFLKESSMVLISLSHFPVSLCFDFAKTALVKVAKIFILVTLWSPFCHVLWSIFSSHFIRPLSSIWNRRSLFPSRNNSFPWPLGHHLLEFASLASPSLEGCSSSTQPPLSSVSESQSWAAFSVLSMFSSMVSPFNLVSSNIFKFLSQPKPPRPVGLAVFSYFL